MKNAIYGVVYVLLSICILLLIALLNKPEAEYEIELINQDSVEIHSTDSDKIYYTTPDSIQHYLEIDNL